MSLPTVALPASEETLVTELIQLGYSNKEISLFLWEGDLTPECRLRESGIIVPWEEASAVIRVCSNWRETYEVWFR